MKFSLNISGFTLQCIRSFRSLYKGMCTWENSHRREFHIRMTFRFLITFTWWLGHLICLHVDKIHVCSKSQTLRMRYPFQSTGRLISHRNKCSFRVYTIPLRDFVPEWNSRPGTTIRVNSRWGDSLRHDILWWYHVNNIEPWGEPEWTRAGAKVAPVSCKHPLRNIAEIVLERRTLTGRESSFSFNISWSYSQTSSNGH